MSFSPINTINTVTVSIYHKMLIIIVGNQKVHQILSLMKKVNDSSDMTKLKSTLFFYHFLFIISQTENSTRFQCLLLP